MIHIDDHARNNMEARGVTDDEVIQTLRHGEVSDARPPRLAREMVFTEGYFWKEHFHPHKRVKVIYAWDKGHEVVVTVISYYGRWEAQK